MKKILLTCALLSLASYTQAANLINHAEVQAQRDCFRGNYSDYAAWRDSMVKKYRKKLKAEEKVIAVLNRFDQTYSEKAFITYQERLTCQTFSYLVNGHKVYGFMIKPKMVENKLPILVYNRGGNGDYGAVTFAAMMRNLFPVADKGFVIIGSQYRGTYNKNSLVDDEFGGKDIADVTTLIKLIPHISVADEKRVGMFGASRGGMQTYLALKQSDNIKAVAVIAGNADLVAGLEQRPTMARVHRKRIPNYDNNQQAELAKRSVLKWLDKLPQDVPILLLHGTSDQRVSVEQSITLADALDKSGMPHKLVLYPGDNHGLSHNRTKANQEIVNWFEKYL